MIRSALGMTDASLRRLARLCFPDITSHAKIVYTGYDVNTVRLPFDLLVGLPFVHVELDPTRADYVDVRIIRCRCVHRTKGRREFYWGYSKQVDVLVVAR